MLRRTLMLMAVAVMAEASVTCPDQKLQCAFDCCQSFEGPNNGFYCCGEQHRQIVKESQPGRADRFFAYGSVRELDYTMLILGLIVSIVLSILLSFCCCLLCNGCWLHRRRNPQMYESVNESGFYPICCGFGIPMGTVVFSSHPPQYRDRDDDYNTSSSSVSSKNRVRFNPDGTPRGVLKNGNGHGQHSPY